MLYKLTLLTLLSCCYATPPPGYVKPPEVDKFPPKYEYGYNIQDSAGIGQGKSESREGVFSLGRYYVQLGGGPKGASQNVEYITDEWGYHPLVEYSLNGEHSQTSAQFALGEKAVEALRKNNRNQPSSNENVSKVTLPKGSTPSSSQPLIVSNVQPVKSVPQQPLSSPIQNKGKVNIKQNIPTATPNRVPKIHHPLQENIPLLQNAIPLPYIFQPVSHPSTQYLLQPQNLDNSALPQAQFLIQEQTLPQTPFLIPLYQTGSENDQNSIKFLQNIPQLSYNIPTAQPVMPNDILKITDQSKNSDTKIQNVRIQNGNSGQISKPSNINFYQGNTNPDEERKNAVKINHQNNKQNFVNQQFIVGNNQIQSSKTASSITGAINNQHQNYIALNQQPDDVIFLKTNAIVQNSKKGQESLDVINNNNNKYLVDISSQNINEHYVSDEKIPVANSIPSGKQNLVVISQNSADGGVNIQNNVQLETSTAKYIEQNKNDQSELQYVSKVIQNELKLHKTEPLFGNTVSEVKYINSNRNIGSSNNAKQISTYDESILGLENPGGYGSRIIAKKPNAVKKTQDFSSSLIDRTRNLVTGVDVLNINDAVTNTVINTQPVVQTEEAISHKNIISEYSNGNVQYGYNENVPNTILEAVSNYNNKNLLGSAANVQNNIQVVQDFRNYDTEKLITNAVNAQIYDTNVQSNINEYIKGNVINNPGYVQINPDLSGYSTGNIYSGSAAVQTQQQNNKLESSVNAVQSPRSKLLEILNSEKILPLKSEVNHISFAEKPIVVAELENYQENGIQSTTEAYTERKTVEETVYSTTQNTIETKITENKAVSTEPPVLITPRPVSNNFLAPITAALSLQASGHDIESSKRENESFESSVEVQKSVPYYLGELDFIGDHQSILLPETSREELLSTKLYIQNSGRENERNEEEVSKETEPENLPRAEALIQTKSPKNNVNIPDQIPQQGQVKHEIASLLNQQQEITNLSPEITSSETEETKVFNKPIEITKYVEKPYPVEVRIPYEVEKIVEKPVEVTKIVEKHVPIHIPQLFPVEVEKIVEKQVKVPVEVTKYIDNPILVHIPVPQPVAVPVEVERLVQTVVKEPYPVEVPVPVEVKVPVPHPVQVTKYIEKPYPVEKIVEKPITVEKIVEKPVTKYVEKPYPVPVHVPIPHPIAVPVEINVPQPYPVEITKYVEMPQGLVQAHSIPVPKTVKVPPPQSQQPQINIQQSQIKVHQPQQQHPVTKLVQIPLEYSKFIERPPLFVNLQQQQKQNPYLYAPKYQVDWKNILSCDLKHNQNFGQHRFVHTPGYVGLVPPQKPNTDFNQHYKRRARNSFGQNLRIEYGFKPPIIPSVQTDEFGMPLNEED